MAPVLGKRKARISADNSTSAEEIFRRHFEAQFKPLEARPTTTREAHVEEYDERSDSASSEESEWGGITDEEDEDTVPVETVDHSSNHLSTLEPTLMTKSELRAYMSSQPPSSTTTTTTSSQTKPPKPKLPEDASNEDAPTLLANDLALRRLLAESHLFGPPTASSPSSTTTTHSSSQPFTTGRQLARARALRLRSLGAAAPPQPRMPMATRKGIAAAGVEREARRRAEAREAGVVLERVAGGMAAGRGRGDSGRGRGRRKGERDVDAPDVGRLRGAELKLSRRDVREIEGQRGGMGKRKKRRR